jgi:hypothetical protein
MKSSANQDDSSLKKFIESARRNGDSKSIFGLLLLLEREICSDAQHRSVSLTPSDRKSLFDWPETTIFRRYIE